MNIRWILSFVFSFFFSLALALQPSVSVQNEIDQINSSLLKNRVHSDSKSLWPHLIGHFQLKASYSKVEVQREVLWWLEHKGYLISVLNHSKPYLAYIYQQTEQHHMPAEFALLPAIESNYNPSAYSRAGATGLWQMMPATASDFNLKMNWWYDGRRDTVASTQTALTYLQDLHSKLNNWLLAAAAYNDGIGSVESAEVKGRSATFWQLSLPEETQTYVPRLLALADIVAHAKRYRITLPKISYQPAFAKVSLTSQMDLAQIAHLAQTKLSTIQKLNPGMRRFATDPGIKSYLLLPRNKVATFFNNLHQVVGRQHISWRYHQVQQGETLAKLCDVFHTNKVLLKWVNHLPKAEIAENEGVLVPLNLHERFKSAYLEKAKVDNSFKVDRLRIQAAVNKVYHSAV